MRSDSRARRPGRFPDFRIPALAAACGLLLLVFPPPSSATPAPAFKIYVEEPGVYRVTYEELRRAGLQPGEVDSEGLALTQGGDELRIWVEDGGDGSFGPGDHIEFVGEQPAGPRSYYSWHSLLNVYRLTVAGPPGQRMRRPPVPAGGVEGGPEFWLVERHLEFNYFKTFDRSHGEDADIWFWDRLTPFDPEPFRLPLGVRNYRPNPRQPMSLTIQLQGQSAAAREIETLRDHRLEVYFDGVLVGAGEWDGEEPYRIELEVPESIAQNGANVLELRVPGRRLPAAGSGRPGDPLIDAVLLDWIEFRYPRGFLVGPEQTRLVLDESVYAARSPVWARVTTEPGAGSVVVYGSWGTRFDSGNFVIEEREDRTIHDFYPPAREVVLWAVGDGVLRPPVAVELDLPSDLLDRSQQADYIIITHPRLRAAIEPLATFHRQRGLTVRVVGVDDVYDEFNHSLLDPGAIRDFLSYAYHHWRRPAPRFVLLVGDASWEPERSLFAARLADGVAVRLGADAAVSPRNLVPTGEWESFKGRAASDNFFVAVDGDDHLPDMAIGRFPATEPEEVAAMVAKTLRYASEPVVGPWRRKILWVTSGSRFMQQRSDSAITSALAERGFELTKLYPEADLEANEQSQEGLQQALDRGQLLVHFLGHGGRFIWRTGVTDYQTKLDLFTIDHLEELAPNDRLPLFLSMTCFTGSFDHPGEDSFGERLLRLEGRGAVAFLGASWKISPVARFSRMLLEELTIPGTIGEAVQRAKQRVKARSLIEVYNLLGDPALELALPELPVEIADSG